MVHRVRKIVAHFQKSVKGTELRTPKDRSFLELAPAQVDSRYGDEVEFHLLHAQAYY